MYNANVCSKLCRAKTFGFDEKYIEIKKFHAENVAGKVGTRIRARQIRHTIAWNI